MRAEGMVMQNGHETSNLRGVEEKRRSARHAGTPLRDCGEKGV